MTAAVLVSRIVTAVRADGEHSIVRDRNLAAALRVIASSSRAGRSLPASFIEAADRTDGIVADSLRAAADKLQIGMRLGAVLHDLAMALGGDSARMFADVLVVQHRRGGDLGALCQRLSRLLHERCRLAMEARAATAPARFTARAVIGLPLVVAVGLAIVSPASMRALSQWQMIVLVTPSLLCIAAGGLVVRHFAVQAATLTSPSQETPSRPSIAVTILAKVAGRGSANSQASRLALACGLLLAAGALDGISRLDVLVSIAAFGWSAWWPKAASRARRRRRTEAVLHGYPTVLELTIAALSAGASAHEAVLLALERAPAPLATLFSPERSQIELGRSWSTTLSSSPLVEESPELEAWLQCLVNADRLGARATDVLELLLRDARAAERERVRTAAAAVGPRIQLTIVLLVVPAIMWIVLVVTAHGLFEQLRSAGVVG